MCNARRLAGCLRHNRWRGRGHGRGRGGITRVAGCFQLLDYSSNGGEMDFYAELVLENLVDLGPVGFGVFSDVVFQALEGVGRKLRRSSFGELGALQDLRIDCTSSLDL